MGADSDQTETDVVLLPGQPELGSDSGRVPWRLDNTGRSDRRVLARTSITLIGRIISKFAILLFLILAARLLSKSQYGIYSYVLVLAMTVGTLADPQVSVIAGRDVASGRSTPAVSYWTAMPIVTLAGIVAAVGLMAFGLIDPGPGASPGMLALAGGFVIFNRIAALGLDMLRAVGRFGLEATIETCGTVLLIAGASAMAALGFGVSVVLAIFLVQSVLIALVCHAALGREVGRPAWIIGDRSRLVRIGLKLSLAAGATVVATRAPLIVLGSVASAVVVASFSAALRLEDAAYLLAITAGQALLPNIAALLTTDPRRATKLTRRAILLSMLVGSALAIVCTPFSSELMRAVFGAKYSSSGALMSIMVLSLPFMGMLWISWFALLAFKRERDVVCVAVFAVAVSVLGAVIAIPDGGATAAAWVYVGVIVVLAIGTFGLFELRARRGER